MSFSPVPYASLNARQKELRNFHKIAGRLADYGFHSMWLSDDWQRADFLAVHIDGETVLRVQLKSGLAINKKYLGKGLHIASRQEEQVFVYPHDVLVEWVLERKRIDEAAASWRDKGMWTWPYLPRWAAEFLASYEIEAIRP